MNVKEYLAKMKVIQKKLLEYLTKEDNIEDDFYKFTSFLKDQNINNQCFKDFLNLIAKISENHHRTINLINKIEKILIFLKEDIIQNFSNTTIFNIFNYNKRILLFLIKEKFIIIDECIYSKLNYQDDYIDYFQPEIISYLLKIEKNPDPIFDEKRLIGENQNYICQLIQKDSIKDFIVYVNKNNLSLSSTKIEFSFYETNSFLKQYQRVSLIEYSAFFGSIQIFRYLYQNGVDLKPSLWLFAIHSNNANMIHILEEYQIIPQDDTFNQCLSESIQCFHNEIAYYIYDNHLQASNYYHNYEEQLIENYNFEFLNENILESNDSFGLLCSYDYLSLVKILINDSKMLINKNEDNDTPLNLAIEKGNIEIIKLLLEQKDLDINLKSIIKFSFKWYLLHK